MHNQIQINQLILYKCLIDDKVAASDISGLHGYFPYAKNSYLPNIMEGPYYLHSDMAEGERSTGEDKDRYSVISASSSESSIKVW